MIGPKFRGPDGQDFERFTWTECTQLELMHMPRIQQGVTFDPETGPESSADVQSEVDSSETGRCPRISIVFRI